MSVVRLLALLSIAIFCGEAAIMFFLDYVPIGAGILRDVSDAAILIIIVFPLLYFFAFRTILTSHGRLEERIRERTADIEKANHSLEHSIKQLNISQREMALLGEMGNFFQVCRNRSEAMVIAETQLRLLFPEFSGALFLMNSSRNILEKAITWGPPVAMDNSYMPDDCWALRRVKPHLVRTTDQCIECQHMRSVDAAWHICLPLTAQGDALGILCLLAQCEPVDPSRNDNNVGSERMGFYVAVAESLALAIANLRLRETLRFQALRDPLTGLFNRRYLLDAFERELNVAAARNQALSVVMFDIDHFKRFNDVFGHAAGDTILTRLGALLREWARSEDIAVRYGGEEFTIILPDTPVDLVFARVESFRQMIESLAIEHYGQPLGQVTISAGVATYPVHGVDRDTLIHVADQALYSSKRNGRNRVTVAPDTAGLAHILKTQHQSDPSLATSHSA